MADANYLLKIDGIDGESKQDGFEDQIEIQSWSGGVSNTGTMASGSGGGGSGKAMHQDYNFVANIDKSCVKKFLACSTGQHIGSAILTCRKSGGTQNVYLTVTFTNVLISNVQWGGTADAAGQVTVTFALNYEQIKWEYSPQDEKGATGNKQTAGIHLAKNKPL